MDVVHVYQDKLTVKKKFKKMYITCKTKGEKILCFVNVR